MHLTVLVAAVLLAAAPEPKPTPAPATPPAAGMDLSKVGSASRKPKDEKAVKKDIDAFLKAQEETMKKHDQEGMLASIDFPVFMVTDDSKGVVDARLVTREEYVAMMKPAMEKMPKEMTVAHKYSVTVLSDAIAEVIDDTTTTVGKQKVAGKASSLLIRRDGKWMWKSMAEAGWGEMAKPATGTAPAK